ncbi:hypothetical protein K7X08_006270 [Anisodus acutangulus]|uniref:DNA 3'-5' helicase n=1 Tax=Anisodus acutangulus TaxID=402998 RepID=A0A9Q1MZD2_9SOLA|nr:hypothetical protein K7X08_006270 [Anisodus acutangulus]
MYVLKREKKLKRPMDEVERRRIIRGSSSGLKRKRSISDDQEDEEKFCVPKKRNFIKLKKIKSETKQIPHVELPENVKNRINELGKRVKEVYKTDASESHNRLSIPAAKMTKFLSDEEEQHLCTRNGKKMNPKKVRVIYPSLRISVLELRRWEMHKKVSKQKQKEESKMSVSYVLNGKWTKMRFNNDIQEGDEIQIWAVRMDDDELIIVLVKLLDEEEVDIEEENDGDGVDSKTNIASTSKQHEDQGTHEEVLETFRLLEEGSVKVLFVSPERFLNSEFLSIFCDTQISLVVIDEGHCVSEWSHNFWPSYMRLKASLLCDKLKAQCILAMTATATTKALYHVMHALDVPSTNLIQVVKPRDSLQLSVSLSENRMKDLMTLLKSSPFSEAKSIIICCKFQSETDFICKYLCDSNISAKSYHSGIFAKDRSRTQELFCANKIRVVVATVAFGMGLNKKDIEAVLHYSLPESLEEYVQEIGRAGRIAYCHIFFDDVSYFKIQSYVQVTKTRKNSEHSDGVDEYVVNRLLCQIFNSSVNSAGKICSLVKESASRKFDMKEEVILIILTQLELGEVQYLHLLPQTSVTCTLNFHQTSALLAMKDAVIAATLKNSEIKDVQYIFDIPSVANSTGLLVVDLTNHLQTLKVREVTYELKDQAYCYVIMEVPKDICSLATCLTKWLSEVESCKVRKMDTMYDAAVFAAEACDKVHGCHGNQHTPCLQRKIAEYLVSGTEVDVPKKIGGSSPFLTADIKVFLQCNSHAKFTPRAIGRILHGIASPAFPSSVWSRTHFWERYMQMGFKAITEAAKVELMNLVGKDALYYLRYAVIVPCLLGNEHESDILFFFFQCLRNYLKNTEASHQYPAIDAISNSQLGTTVKELRNYLPVFKVMYDATGVRLQAGRQAEVLNQIVCELPAEHPLADTMPLRELLGHTPPQKLREWSFTESCVAPEMQVVAGGFLGLATGTIVWLITGSGYRA